METNQLNRYSAEEIFAVFVEAHRLSSPLDVMADETYVLTPETTIEIWREAQDLLEWEEHSTWLNSMFQINVLRSEWYVCYLPEHKRTIFDVCRLIATHAVKPSVQSKKILGTNCYTAALFLNFKNRLRAKGVNVSELHPSSDISSYLDKYFSPMIEEVALSGVQVFEKLNYHQIWREKQNPNWLDKLFWPKERVGWFDTGSIVTFRDVISRISERSRRI